MAIAGLWDDQGRWAHGQVPLITAVVILGGAAVGIAAIMLAFNRLGPR